MDFLENVQEIKNNNDISIILNDQPDFSVRMKSCTYENNNLSGLS